MVVSGHRHAESGWTPEINTGCQWTGIRVGLRACWTFLENISWYVTSRCAVKICCMCIRAQLYRVIHKSLRNFRPLLYSSRDGHAEGDHVNRGRDTPSFCPTLQMLNILTSEGSWQTFLAHARQSRPMASAGVFVSQRTGSHCAGISCTTHELFCP